MKMTILEYKYRLAINVIISDDQIAGRKPEVNTFNKWDKVFEEEILESFCPGCVDTPDNKSTTPSKEYCEECITKSLNDIDTYSYIAED